MFTHVWHAVVATLTTPGFILGAIDFVVLGVFLSFEQAKAKRRKEALEERLQAWDSDSWLGSDPWSSERVSRYDNPVTTAEVYRRYEEKHGKPSLFQKALLWLGIEPDDLND
jgi:hypothetical protein